MPKDTTPLAELLDTFDEMMERPDLARIDATLAALDAEDAETDHGGPPLNG